MSDFDQNPFDDFQRDPGVPMRPLAAAEVRRRGDRFRRRRSALVAAGAAAAVIAIAAPVAILNSVDQHSAPNIADPPSPTPSVASTPSPTPPATPSNVGDIPEDFPLLEGLPAQAEPGEPGREGPDRGLTPPTYALCEEIISGPAAFEDRLGAGYSNIEDYRLRTLYTFADAGQAVDYVNRLREAFMACPETERDDEGFSASYEVADTLVAGQSFAAVRLGLMDGLPLADRTTITVARLGRAVLLESRAGEGSAAGAAQAVDTQNDQAAAVIAAMCQFTEAGC